MVLQLRANIVVASRCVSGRCNYLVIRFLKDYVTWHLLSPRHVSAADETKQCLIPFTLSLFPIEVWRYTNPNSTN